MYEQNWQRINEQTNGAKKNATAEPGAFESEREIVMHTMRVLRVFTSCICKLIKQFESWPNR